MTTQIMPSVEITGPPVVPYPFGVFTVAPATTPDAPGWRGGVWWLSRGCAQVGITYDPCTVDDTVDPLDPNVICGVDTAAVFTVYARSDLSMGGMTLDARDQQARDYLLAGEQKAVESALWALMVAETGVAAGVAGSIHEAVAMADALITDVYGGTPVIHLSRYTASMALSQYGLRVDGTRLRSMLGSDAVAGAGYEPVPTTAGVAVDVIATGPVVVVRGDVQVFNDARNPVTNQIDTLVFRTYAVGWDCTAVRVHVPATP